MGSYSTWGGESSYIEEGLKRYQEEQKRKQEEERQRQLAEQQRLASVMPPFLRSQAPLVRNPNQPNPNLITAISKPKPPIQVSNPLPQVDTAAPQISYTPPPSSDTTVEKQGPSTPMARVNMPIVAPQQPAPSFQGLRAWRNQSNPNMTPPVGVIQPTAPTLIGKMLPAMAEVAKPYLDQAGNYIKQGIDAAGPTLDAIVAATAPGGFLPALTKDARLTTEQRQSQSVRSPTQQVLDRYTYNLLEKPQDAADQLLLKFAPSVFQAMKGMQAMSMGSELVGTIPNAGIILGHPGKTLGEAWAIGNRAANIYNQQYGAWLHGVADKADPEWVKTHHPEYMVNQNASPADMGASLQLADDDYYAAMASIATRIKSASPVEIANAINGFKSMAWHGIPAASQQAYDLLDYPAKATDLRDQAINAYNQAIGRSPTDPQREGLLWQAASLGAQAKQLADTHPAQLFDKNANWAMALPFEFIFDPINLLDAWLKFLELAPKARRLAQGAGIAGMTVEEAAANLMKGSSVAPTVEQTIMEAPATGILSMGLLHQNANSKAAVEARNNWRALSQLVKGFTTKEDFLRITKAYIEDPIKMLTEGIPASDLTSDIIRILYPATQSPEARALGPQLGPGNDVIKWGAAIFGNHDAIKSAPSLKNIEGLIDSMPSLQGTGQVKLGDWATEMYTLLLRGGGERYGVATLAGVPAGAKRASTVLSGMGDMAKVQYYGAGSKTILETAEMPLAKANAMVKDFSAAIKKGSELTSGWLEQAGNLQRSIYGPLILYSNPKSVINNFFSNRTIAAADGVWSLKGYKYYKDFIEGIHNGAVPFDQIASALNEVETSAGGVNSMFNNVVDKLPPFKQIRQWRQFDENQSKVVAYGKTLEDFLHGKGWQLFKPAAEQFLKDAGWTDKDAISHGMAHMWDSAMRGGSPALLRSVYDIANGTQPASTAALVPHYQEVFGKFASGLDNIVKTAKPETINEALGQLNDLMSAAHENLTGLTNNYVFGPGRQYYTRLDDQKAVTDLGGTLKTVASQLGEDYATGVQPYLEEMIQGQRDVNKNVAQLIQMANGNPDAGEHIYKLWDGIIDLRDKAHSELNRLADGLFNNKLTIPELVQQKAAQAAPAAANGQPAYFNEIYKALLGKGEPVNAATVQKAHEIATAANGNLAAAAQEVGALIIPDGNQVVEGIQDATNGASDGVKSLMDYYRKEQSRVHTGLKDASNALIEEARTAIASGEQALGNNPVTKALEKLGFNEQKVFDYNKLRPGTYNTDPNRSAAIKAGQEGVSKFITQMLTLVQGIQEDGTGRLQTGIDHFLSSMDDVSHYYAKEIGPTDGALKKLSSELYAKLEEIKLMEEGPAKSAAFKQNGSAWDAWSKQTTDLWNEYYQFAYSRHQAASAMIAQTYKDAVGMPRFVPLDNWGATIRDAEGMVEIAGRNIRNGEFLIKTPEGKYVTIPKIAIPQEAIDQWGELSRNLYQQLAGQVGKLGVKAFAQGTGFADVDKLIEGIRTSTNNPVFDAVRSDIANYARDPMNYGDIGADMTRWYQKQMELAAESLRKAMPGIAARNAQRGPVIPMGKVGEASNSFRQLWDNIMVGANHSAEEMVKFSLIDFANKYGGDSVAGFFAPYLYWSTRQGKNMIERMLFNPLLFSYLGRATSTLQSVNRANNEPQRYNDSINTGITLPNDETLYLENPLPHWAPFGLQYIFQGWGDTDRANQGSEVLLNNMESNGWPGWNGLAGGLMTASEVAGATGMPQYAHWRDLLLAANGRGGEIDLSSNIGWLGTIIGQGYSAVTGKYQQGLNRYYDPYVTSRDIADQGFGVNDNGQYAQAAGQAQYEGRPLLPEFSQDHPQAQADWTQAFKNQSLENLVFALLGGTLGVSMSSMDPKEKDRLAAQKLYGDMGWNPQGNPTGSRERTQMLDPTSPNYVPGLATGQSAYQVIGEGPQRENTTPAPPVYPFLPTYETKDIDKMVSLGDYLDQRNAIVDKYKAADEAMRSQHPEWGSSLADPARSQWTQQQIDAQGTEIDALDAKYPDIAGQFAAKTPASLRGANPAETTLEAMSRLYRQAQEAHAAMKPAGDFPRDGTNQAKDAYNRANDAYKAAVMSTFQGTLNDPTTISQSVFGRPLDATGPMPGQPSPRVGPPDSSGAGPTDLAQPLPGSAVPSLATEATTPTSQYDSDFAASEKANGLPPGLLSAVAQNESGYDASANSKAGAQGLMQIMPKTWAEWAPKVGATDPYNAQDSIKVAGAYLAWLQGQLPKGQQGIVGLMTAYNMGIGNVQAGVAPSAATTAYANTIANAVSGNQTPTATGDPSLQGPTFVSPLPSGTKITQGFGDNVQDYAQWNGDHGHEGIDYGVPVGTPVGAAATGTVEFAGTGNGFGNYGNYIVIDHGNGYKTYYGHLSEFKVSVGDTVNQGDIVALSGDTGRTTGPHLHFSIRKDGDTTGPYGMVDPAKLLGQPSSHLDLSVTPLTSNGEGVTLRSTQSSKPASNPVNLPETAQEFVQSQSDKYKGPVGQQQARQLDDAWTAAYDRIKATYPDDASLFDQYKAINTEDRPDWKAAHPMIKALNFLVYDQDAWQQMEDTYGTGVMSTWANRPAYGGPGDDAISIYYHEHPDVFLVNSWIQGRPEVHTDDYDPAQANPYDLGKDFDEAKTLFGDNIWDVVKQYYQTPKYVKGGDNTAWLAFKTQYPQFDDWRKWWYANLGDQQTAASGFGYGSHGYSSSSFHRGKSTRPNYINPVGFEQQAAPRFSNPGGNGDWRQFFDNRVNVKNPRK